jgi:uncharacterized protein (TIGR03000 family)
MFRKLFSYGGRLLLVGVAIFAMPGFSWAQRGGGGHGGGAHFGGAHFGGAHFGGYHGGFSHGGYGYRSYSYTPHYGSYYHGSSPYFGSYHRYPYHGYYRGYYGAYPYVGYSPTYGSDYYGSYGSVTPYYSDDYTSVQPAASDPTYSSSVTTGTTSPNTTAHITANVPTGARLWFDGNATTSTGSVREFYSPPLKKGSRYAYTVRARWKENGHEVTQTQQVKVTAGAHINVTFPVRGKSAVHASAAKKG